MLNSKQARERSGARDGTAGGRNAKRARLPRTLICLFLVVLVAAALAPSAGAHAFLVRSDPPEGGAVETPPTEIRLWFDEEVSPKFSTVELLDGKGRTVPGTAMRGDPADPHLLVLSLPELEHGFYSVDYWVLSNDDGHFRRGLALFGLGTELAPVATAGDGGELAPPPTEAALRWASFAFLAAVIGALAVAALVFAPLARLAGELGTAARAAHRRVLRVGALCAGLGALFGIGLLAWQAVSVSGAASEPFASVLWELLADSRWGALWGAREGLLLALAATCLYLGRQPRAARAGLAVGAAMVGALATVQALSGHAAGVATQTGATIATSAAHILAAGLWTGALAVSVVALWPLGRNGTTSRLARASLRRFGWLAVVGVGLVAVTGLLYAARQVASPDALLTTLYGQVLTAKVGTVAAICLLGLLNAMLLHPRVAAPVAWLLGRPEGWTPLPRRRLKTLVLAEAGLGLAVLAAVAVLATTAPARGPQFVAGPSPDEAPGALTQSVEDLAVTLQVQPNRPGQNVFTVFAGSSRRPAPAEITGVTLRLAGEDGRETLVALEEVDPGRYRRFRIGGEYLALAGSWDVDVLIERADGQRLDVAFDWAVPSAIPRPALVSNRPLEPILTRAAAVVGAGWLLTVLALLLARRRRSAATEPDLSRSRPAHPVETA